MAHAEKCPLCGGEGVVIGQPNKCHGCDGKGWVTVQDGDREPCVPVPWYPVYPTYPYPFGTWPVIYSGASTTGIRSNFYPGY